MIDLHIHSHCSDGALTVEELFKEAETRNIRLMSITDHDSINCQEEATLSAQENEIHYIPGVELNINFFPTGSQRNQTIPLDLLGYRFDIQDKKFKLKLQLIAKYREERAAKIMKNINTEFRREGIAELTKKDFEEIQEVVDGVLGRPHIANYLVKKGIVRSRQEAFDKYLVKCNVPKYPLNIEEASKLVRDSGGIVVLAHPNDPHGTSLVKLTKSLDEQTSIIKKSILRHIDGVECWHSRNDASTTSHYVKFAREHGLIMTGGSDCHQKPIIMGTVRIPEYVAEQFNR
jgi:predicted metal-dependent phosphoesterase TrpH